MNAFATVSQSVKGMRVRDQIGANLWSKEKSNEIQEATKGLAK